MTLADISDLSQAIAAVAVVVSLIYLALQTRQSARNQRAMMHADRAQSIRTFMLKIADPTFAPIYRAGGDAAPDMDVLDAHQFGWYSFAQLNSMQEQFLDWREGLIDDGRWTITRGVLQSLLGLPGHRALYRIWRDGAHADFRAMADGLLEGAKGKPRPDMARAWLALAAEERAALAQGGSPAA